jgi:stage V sporulation protein D (sporulation-specific penicillin-binding protein)
MKTSKRNKTRNKKKNQENRVLVNVNQRIGLVLFIILGLLAFLFFRLVSINSNDGSNYEKIVLSQQVYSSTELKSKRGEIWDRNGTKLALDEKVYNLIIDPSVMLDDDSEDSDINVEPTVKALVYCFGYDATKLENKINAKKDSKYIRYEKQISSELVEKFNAYKTTFNKTKDYKKAEKAADLAERIAKGEEVETEEESTVEETESEETTTKTSSNIFQKLWNKFFGKEEEDTEEKIGEVAGIWFEEEYKRAYPYNSLACDTIGFIGSEQSFGLEAHYDDVLSGIDGRKYGYVQGESSVEKVLIQPTNGNTLVTTLDYYIQSVCEKVVADYDKNTGSKNTSVLVMNPKNGEIYAMASSNPYDLNESVDLTQYYSEKELEDMTEEEQSKAMLEIIQNYCISNAYEPGSTAKIFTIAAGLEENVINGNETYKCDGVGTYGGTRIHCYKREGHGKLTVTQSLMVSCNDALMQIAMLEGVDVFSKYQSIFGIGQKTGIDLPDEEDCSNLYYTADEMSVVDLATNSFGQNFYTTMIQMAAAYSSVVNGGNYYEPHLVKQILDSDGNVVENIDKTLLRKTVSTKTSEFIKQALYQTCEEGSGKKAKVAGYQIGGKTGTAEKNEQGATGADETYVVSFIAVVPALDPEVVIYALVDEPNIEKQSDSSQATSICKSVMEEILPYLNIYPTEEVDTDTDTDTEEIEVFEDSIIED